MAAAVVPDSYAGVFPRQVEGKLIRELGFCASPLLAPYRLERQYAALDAAVQDKLAHQIGTTPLQLHIDLASLSGDAASADGAASATTRPQDRRRRRGKDPQRTDACKRETGRKTKKAAISTNIEA